MSNLDHITGAAFVGPNEAQYLKWLDEAAGEQKRLEAQRDRLAQACLRYRDVVDRLAAEMRQDTPDADDLIADAERDLTDGDKEAIG